MSSNKKTTYPAIRIRNSTLKSVQRRHPWIFSGGIIPPDADIAPGSIVAVQTARGEHAGFAFYSPGVAIALRMISFSGEPPAASLWQQRLQRAFAWRTNCPELRDSSGWRLVNGEADGLPGLIIDHYAGHCIVQSLCSGADNLLPEICAALTEYPGIQSVFERSDHAGRSQEGLEARCGQIAGRNP
jgi:23S rRNA (cytosine1962-C5)-methyltransferase